MSGADVAGLELLELLGCAEFIGHGFSCGERGDEGVGEDR